MTKKIIYSLFTLLSISASAQQGNSSVYSYFGVGDVKFKGTVENRSMGTVAIQADSIHLNLQNPAAYAVLNRSTVSFGGSNSRITISDDIKSGKAVRSSLDYFAIGLPLGKAGIGFGLMPYSSVGYAINSGAGTSSVKSYDGTGGMNRVYLATGFKINKEFYFGVEGNYNFGNIETNSAEFYSSNQYGTRINTRSDLSGFGISLGLQHSKLISNKLSVYSSISYSPQINVTATNIQKRAAVLSDGNGGFATIEEFQEPIDNSSIKLPSKISIGLGLGQTRKWFVGAEIVKQKSSTFSNRIPGISNATYEDATKMSLGGYITPNYSAYSGYWKKITYRAGFRYENTGLVVKENAIKESAISAGLGLPLGGVYSNINIGLEYGSRGTTNLGLVKEDFITILISLSLNDKWFNKRKID